MKKHTINKEDLKGFIKEIELAASHGNGTSKTLIAHVNFDNKGIYFKVISQGETFAEELDLNRAIDTYNEI